MKNLFQDSGDRTDLLAPTGGCVSGGGYVVGSIFGVAMHDAAQATMVTLKTEGIVELPKAAGGGVTFAAGAKVFWDDTTKTCIASATGAFKIGTAPVAAVNADTSVRVRLNGIDVTAV